MDYEIYLELIKKLENSSLDKNNLEQFINLPVNPNINDLILPKINNMIETRINTSVQKTITELEAMFSDNNYLDLCLVNFKKEIQYILDLINSNLIPQSNKVELKNEIKEKTNKVYDILIKESLNIDQTGILKMTIDNNRIKWSSDNNEL